MRYPLINKKARQSVNIPELAGGMNLRDSVSLVADNQLTDAVNMWFHDGVLKTRPSIITDSGHNLPFRDGNIIYDTQRVEAFPETEVNINGQRYILSCVKSTNITGMNTTRVDFYLVGSDMSTLGYIEISQRQGTCFVFQKKDLLYCFCSDRKIYTFDINNVGKGENPTWKQLSNEEIYAPIAMTHCKTAGTGNNGPVTQHKEDLLQLGATQFEGFNLLGNSYRMIYSTVNKDLITSEKAYHEMCYCLLYNPAIVLMQDESTLKVKAKITHANGKTYFHEVEIIGADNMEDSDPGDGLYMRVMGIYVTFHEFSGGEYPIKQVTEDDFVEDNLELIAPCPNSEENLDKVFNMTQAEWFGGASMGINGGTRLFLGGNTKEEEKSLLIWSGLDEPLYFSENCYSYVGKAAQAVTSFGKQSDMLIIFKENETYFTQYTQNTSITADSLINQSVVDYAANRVYFPLTLLNANIGCSCPDTVQLCRNRLVWTNLDGRVYTLVSNNQYSERNIYEVGEMVERDLKKEDLTNASSCDWEGHYVLLVKNHVYLMDYNSSGYQYVYSYQKNEDANVRIPWYKWELPLDRNMKFCHNGDRKLYVFSANTSGATEYWFDTESNQGDIAEPNVVIELRPIHSSLTTKLFDFGMGGYRKNVEQVTLMLGNNGGAPITVGFVTDCGTEHDEITLDGEETQAYTAGYIRALSLSPCIRSVLRFGVRLECDGPLAVDGMTLDYKILGGAR